MATDALGDGCVIPPAGLVSWWRAEGSGTDQAGRADGTLVGNTSYVPGRVGQAFVFDGQGDAVNVGNPPELQLQDFTIEAWVRRSSLTQASLDPWSSGNIFGHTWGGYNLAMTDAGVIFMGKVGYGAVYSTLAITDTNVFHHVAVSKAGTNIVFHLDGLREVAAPYDPGYVFVGPAAIGARGDDWRTSFLGAVDELAIYSRALSAAELGSIYQAGSAGKCIARNPPQITEEPESATALIGSTHVFSVIATGTEPLSYQWVFNGVDLPASNSSTLALSNVQPGQAGAYTVRVANPWGTVLSGPAELLVVSPAVIAAQPESRTNVVGTAATFTVAGGGTPPLAYQWLLNGEPIAGAESAALMLASVQPQNAGVYRVAVSNAWGAALSDPTELVVLVPPTITAQPENRTVLVGTTASFTVLATGSEPLTFQWEFNEVPIPGATDATLVLEAVQPEQAGEYAVVVSNAAGTITSSAAVLRVTDAAAEIRLVGGTVDNRTAVEVPIVLQAKGDENALGLNVEFDPLLLALTGVQKGADAQPGAILYNDGQVSVGRAGLALALPTGTTFAPGTREVFRLLFDVIAPHAPTQQVATLAFVDTPTVTQLVGSDAAVLPARYVADSLIIRAAAYEGDIAPRPDGDQQLSVADWVQAGRFVAQLETPAEGSEFQRADCAPRATFGDGQISIIDWVQTGLYAAGLTPPTLGGGPVTKADGLPRPIPVPQNDANRVLRVVDAVIDAGETSTVIVLLEAEGGENALGFSLSFDPARLTFLAVSKAPGMDSATLNVNVAHQADGRLGFALALPISEGMAAAAVDVLHLEFAATAGEHGTSTVAFGNDPVLREVSDALANPLLTTYIDGTVTVMPDRPALEIRREDGSLLLAWPAAADTFIVEGMAADLGSGGWERVDLEVEGLNGQRIAPLPASNGTMLYRLRQQ